MQTTDIILNSLAERVGRDSLAGRLSWAPAIAILAILVARLNSYLPGRCIAPYA